MPSIAAIAYLAHLEQDRRMGMAKNEPEASLSIGEVAGLLKISAGVIRMWEREALIRPDRTKGSHRQFRTTHIERLRRIADFYFGQKLNPAAIRRELGQVPAEATVAEVVDARLGAKLRAIRQEQGMTLSQTAEASDLSASFISALERGNSGVSLNALFRLAEALGTTLPTLTGTELAPAERRFVRAGDRQRFTTDSGKLVIEDIVSRPAGMEAQISHIAPGCHSGDFISHHGQEFVHVLEGTLLVRLQPDEEYRLGPGDTLYFHSHLRHHWANETENWVKVLWVNAAFPARYRASGDTEPALEPEF